MMQSVAFNAICGSIVGADLATSLKNFGNFS